MRDFAQQFSVTNNFNVIIFSAGFRFSYSTKKEQGENPTDTIPDHLFYNCYLTEQLFLLLFDLFFFCSFLLMPPIIRKFTAPPDRSF